MSSSRLESVVDQVLQDARVGRKFNVDVRIASQLVEDFPSSMVDVATALLVRGAGSERSIDRLDGHFRLMDEEKRVMRGELTGPSPEGARFWAMFSLWKEGAVRQKLNLTLGPGELWAFSTTAEDVALRQRFYGTIGPRLARKDLARRFPGGTARPETESRTVRIDETGGGAGSGWRDALGEFVEELTSAAYLLEDRD